MIKLSILSNNMVYGCMCFMHTDSPSRTGLVNVCVRELGELCSVVRISSRATNIIMHCCHTARCHSHSPMIHDTTHVHCMMPLPSLMMPLMQRRLATVYVTSFLSCDEWTVFKN